jgi:hypothetical protein
VPRAPRRRGDGGRQAARLSVKVKDRGHRVRQMDIGLPAGARCVNAAVPIRSNLLRLEHELRTVVNGSTRAAAITRVPR